MSSATEVDLVAVMARAVALDLPSASEASLVWADRAALRLRRWIDAWHAAVQTEMMLPRPLPPRPDFPAEGAPSGDVRPSAESEISGAPDQGAAEGELPLPSLGSEPVAQESPRERERRVRRAALLAELPEFAAALRGGLISTGHVDVLAAAIETLAEAVRIRVLSRSDDLLRMASNDTPERFSRCIHRMIQRALDEEGIDRVAEQRARSGLRRGVDEATKMHWVRIDIDPERGARLFARLDAEREAIFHGGHHRGLNHDQVELQALWNLMGAPGSSAEQRSSTKAVHGLVLIDIETWLTGAHDRTVCETGSGVPLPPDTVRRMLCMASLTYGLTLGGRVVGQATTAQLATPDQRRALRMMYRTCCHPDCTRPFDHCQIHHVVFRSRHGPTEVSLMVPLCTTHHDAIHHHGWSLGIDADRTLTWTTPDDTALVCPFVPLADLDRPPDVGDPHALRLFDDVPKHPPAA